MIKTFLKDEGGATAIEYGLIAALISIGIIVVLGNVRDSLKDVFTKIADALANAN